jgi:hypothetical protein
VTPLPPRIRIERKAPAKNRGVTRNVSSRVFDGPHPFEGSECDGTPILDNALERFQRCTGGLLLSGPSRDGALEHSVQGITDSIEPGLLGGADWALVNAVQVGHALERAA